VPIEMADPCPSQSIVARAGILFHYIIE